MLREGRVFSVHMGKNPKGAGTLLRAGISSYDRQDLASASIYFALANHLFHESNDALSARIAKDWSEATQVRRQQPQVSQ